MSGKYRCPLCLSAMYPGRCADLDVLVCVNCGKTVETAVADVACVSAKAYAGAREILRRVGDGIAVLNGWTLRVPSSRDTNWFYHVRNGNCLSCKSDRCRHAVAARLWMSSPSPDGVTPAPQTTPSLPVSAARPSGRTSRA